jgi:hypothetical protein
MVRSSLTVVVRRILSQGRSVTLRIFVLFFATFGLVAAANSQTIQGPPTPIPPNFFGMTIHNATTTTPWPPFPIHAMRLWDVVAWAPLNKAEGVYDWSRLDQVLETYNSHGVTDILFTFGMVPSWASGNPASACVGLGGDPVPITSIRRSGGAVTVTTARPHHRKVGDPIGIGGTSDSSFGGGFAIASVVNDTTFTYRQDSRDASSGGGTVYGYGGCKGPLRSADAAVTFARALATRYCGRIRDYELWNEPDMGKDAPSFLAELDGTLYSTLKDPSVCGCSGQHCAPGLGGQNPNIVVSPAISSTFPNQLKWLSDYASSSRGRSADIVGFHGYGYHKAPEHFSIGVKNVKTKSGIGDSPAWDTEASWGKDETLAPELRPAWVAKAHVMQWLSGVSRYYWYAFDNASWGTLWTASGGLNPAGVAYGETYKWLVGATLKQCQVSDAQVLCTLTRSSPSNYNAYIGWSSSGNSSFRVPNGFTEYRTLDGNVHPVSAGQEITLDTNPVLLETAPVPSEN